MLVMEGNTKAQIIIIIIILIQYVELCIRRGFSQTEYVGRETVKGVW